MGEAVGDHFEVEEHAGLVAFEEEFEELEAEGDAEVEGAVDEFEFFDATVEEVLEGGEEAVEGEAVEVLVEGGEAEFAGEGAAAGGFDVDDAVGDVFVGVEVVGEGDEVGVGGRGGDEAFGGRGSGEEVAAKLGEGEVGFAGEDVVGGLADGLVVDFVADFGAAEDDEEVGAEAAEEEDGFGDEGDVPDVDAEACDAGVVAEDVFGEVEGSDAKVAFEEGGLILEVAEVGKEVAEPEGGMAIAGVDRGEDDGGHGQRVRGRFRR